ncbi:MAG: hypothetical protein R3A10_13035 [Caldilineaceae bacterium]
MALIPAPARGWTGRQPRQHRQHLEAVETDEVGNAQVAAHRAPTPQRQARTAVFHATLAAHHMAVTVSLPPAPRWLGVGPRSPEGD